MAASRQQQDLREATIHGLRWTAISRPVIEIALLGSMVILARLISPAEFGHYAVAIVFAEIAVMIPGEGVGNALVQRKDVQRRHLQAGMALAIGASVVLALLTVLAARFVIRPLLGSATSDLVMLSSPGVLLAGAGTVSMALLRRRLAFARLSIVDILGTVSRAVACVGFALLGLGGAALVLGGLVSSVIILTLLVVSAPPPLPRLRREPARELLEYGLPASLAAVSWVGFRNCDYAIVSARLGAASAGYYFRAYQLAVEYQKKISLVMGMVGFPVLSRSPSWAELTALRGQMVRLLTVTLFPLLTTLAVVAPVFVPWLFGPEWEPAVVPTQILALGGASTLVVDTVGATLMATGRTRALLGFGWVQFIVYSGAVFIGAGYGLAAAAGAAALVHTLSLPAAYVVMLRDRPVAPMRALWHDTAPAVVSCAGLLACAWPVSVVLSAAGLAPLLYLFAVSAAAAIGYMAVLRTCFGDSWLMVRTVAAHVLPDSLRGARGRALVAARVSQKT